MVKITLPHMLYWNFFLILRLYVDFSFLCIILYWSLQRELVGGEGLWVFVFDLIICCFVLVFSVVFFPFSFALHWEQFISSAILLNLRKRSFSFKQTTTLFQHADLTVPSRSCKRETLSVALDKRGNWNSVMYKCTLFSNTVAHQQRCMCTTI